MEEMREDSSLLLLSLFSSIYLFLPFPQQNWHNKQITMFDINEDYVICDGMKMSRKDAIEYMQGR